jgi:MFS family permease
MQLSGVMRGLRANARWLRPEQLSLENRNILYFTIDTALQGLMMGGIFSFISVFIVRLGATELQTSLLTSLPAIVMTLASIPSGQLVQRQRDLVRFTNIVRAFHRGSVLLVALLPFMAHETLIQVIIVVWTAKAITNAMLESSWMAVIAEVIPPHRRARVNGVRWTVMSIVTAAAVAVFGYLLDRLPFPLNYQIVFVISFIGGSVGMIFWGKLRIPENVQLRQGDPLAAQGLAKQLRSYWRSLQLPAFVRYELTTGVLRLGMNMPAALYSIYWIRRLNASDLWIGWQSTTSQIATIVGYTLWGRIISRQGHFRPLLVCTAGIGLYPVLTALVPSQAWLPFVSIVQGFFVTGVNLSFFDTLLAVCPTERRPSFIAVNTMLASLMIFAAPLLGSALASWIDIRGVFYVAGAIHLAAVLLFGVFRVADEPQ